MTRSRYAVWKLAAICALALLTGGASEVRAQQTRQIGAESPMQRQVLSIADFVNALDKDSDRSQANLRDWATSNMRISFNDGKIGFDFTGEYTPHDESNAEALVRLIVRNIAMDSWSDVGGNGTIQYYQLGEALIIRQTPKVLEQIVSTLELLRKLGEVEVQTKIDIVSVPRGASLLYPNLLLGQVETEALMSEKVLFLDGARRAALRDAIESRLGGDVYPVPMVTAFDGQKWRTGVGDEVRNADQVLVETGVRAKCQSSVSADRRFVRQSIDLTWLPDDGKHLQSAPLALNTTAVIPDGGAAIFYLGKTISDEGAEAQPPLLSKIPELDRLFAKKPEPCQEHDVFVLVTSRVIVNDDSN